MVLITLETFEAVVREVLSRSNGRKDQLSFQSEASKWSCFFGTDLNRGGRRLLRMTRDVQAGLWPLLLEWVHSPTVVSEYYGGPNQALTVLWVMLRYRVLLEQQY